MAIVRRSAARARQQQQHSDRAPHLDDTAAHRSTIHRTGRARERPRRQASYRFFCNTETKVCAVLRQRHRHQLTQVPFCASEKLQEKMERWAKNQISQSCFGEYYLAHRKP
jgi:hypothetical protein